MLDEQQVRAAFDALRSGGGSDAAVAIASTLEDPAYRDGELAILIAGGIIDDAESGLPTGLAPITSLRDLHHKYSEVDWLTLLRVNHDDIPARLAYVARTFVDTFAWRTWEPLPIGSNVLRVLHLNTYRQVPLFSDFSRHSVEAQTLSSYGFPAIYVSRLEQRGDGTFDLSDCSIDIYHDRAAHDLSYDRGLIYEIDPSHVFQVDRKSNIAYQNYFIGRELRKPEFSRFTPNVLEVKSHAGRLTELTNTTDWGAPDDIELLIHAARDLRFSVLGYCLFEATHEYAMRETADTHQANQLILAIDPNQSRHWSMRAFQLGPDLVTMRDRIDAAAIAKIDAAGLEKYLRSNVAYKVRAFLGDEAALAEECALNSLFQERWHDLEAGDDQFDFGSVPLPKFGTAALRVSLPNVVGVDLRRGRLVFHSLDVPTADESMLASQLATVYDAGEVAKLIDDQRYKKAYLRVREAMGANTLRVILNERLGRLAVPFQPDPRGELLLLPDVDDQSRGLAARARIFEEADKIRVEQLEPVQAPVVIRDLGSLDPSLRTASQTLYSTLAATNADLYRQVFEPTMSTAIGWLTAQRESLRTDLTYLAVVIPFYKERFTYLRIIEQVIREFRDTELAICFIMVSNQEPGRFAESVAAARTTAKRVAREDGVPHTVLAVNTALVSRLEHWMVEKFINCHIGTAVVRLLIDGPPGISIRYVAYLEGDLETAGEWVAAARPYLTSEELDVLLFDHDVVTKGEEAERQEPSQPNYDTSDAILARLVAAPLTEVVLGSSIPQLFGGSFIIRGDLTRTFARCLDTSVHAESLVESWIPTLLAGVDHKQTCRILNVTPKVHLPPSSEQYSTDLQTIKWVADLFFALEGYVLARLEGAQSPTLQREERRAFDFSPDETGGMERRRERLRHAGHLGHVWRAVLGSKLASQHDALVDAIASEASDAVLGTRVVSDDDWVETIVRFFVNAQRRRAEEPEELFALRLLIDARLLAMQRLSVSHVDLKPSERCIDDMRLLIEQEFGVAVP